MGDVARTLGAARKRCIALEEVIERNARSLGRTADFAERVAKVYGSDKPLEDLDEWELAERRAGLAGLAQRLLEAQAILRTDDGTGSERLRSLMAEPEIAVLESGRAIGCYPITIATASTIAQRQEIIGRCVAARVAAEAHPDTQKIRHRLESIRTWQRTAIIYEVTLPPGSPFTLPKDPPALARIIGRAIAWLDGANRFDREFWRTRAAAHLAWRVLDRLVPGRWLARLSGVPSWWCWLVSAVDEMAIVRAHLMANDERARRLPRLHASGEATGWHWSDFAAAVADARHTFTPQFIHDVSMLTMLTDFQITAKRRQDADKKRKAEQPAKRSKTRSPKRARSRH